MTDESRTCPACGGTELSWGSTIRGPTGVAQGLHHTGELTVQVFLGCACGETIEVHDFWEPSKVVGVWTRFGPLEEQLVTAADPLLFDAAVRYTVAGWVESWHGTPWALDKKGLVHALCRHHGRVKDHSLVERAVDRAIELGLFEEKEPGQWAFVGSRR